MPTRFGELAALRCFGIGLGAVVGLAACAGDDRSDGNAAGAFGALGGNAGAKASAGMGGVTATGGASGAAPGGGGAMATGSGGDSGAKSSGAAGAITGGSATAGSGGLSPGGAGQGGTGGSGGAGAGGANSAGSAGLGAGGGAAGSSPSCQSELAPGNSNRTIEVGGMSRTYVLHVPSNYTGKAQVPLVLDFHGLGGSGMQQQSSSGMQQVADREGFLIAFPNGIDNAWNIGPCCTSSRTVDDLGFAKGIIADVAGEGCVDAKRVYATGFSMGGGMSHFLGCQAPDTFAAVAPAAFDLLVPAEQDCAPSRPIGVIAFRGTSDPAVPFAGGRGSGDRVTFMGAQASFERWADLDGCVEPTTSSGECTYYEQCEGGVRVGLCVEQGGGHGQADATVAWTFLSQFSLP